VLNRGDPDRSPPIVAQVSRCAMLASSSSSAGVSVCSRRRSVFVGGMLRVVRASRQRPGGVSAHRTIWSSTAAQVVRDISCDSRRYPASPALPTGSKIGKGVSGGVAMPVRWTTYRSSRRKTAAAELTGRWQRQCRSIRGDGVRRNSPGLLERACRYPRRVRKPRSPDRA